MYSNEFIVKIRSIELLVILNTFTLYFLKFNMFSIISGENRITK